ncbi:MAG: hypothetical protein CMN32_00075 [Saprospirales bacterium]|nr:hypothetical protein [Saprospirales bacterium]
MTTLRKYNEQFLAELERLNPRQREAVEQIEGPVLVIAGPGTGKTHILASRIGRILLETDTQPHNILCLTFTDAGVRAMKKRLVQLIGPEGHRVHIYTFHSFCNKLIQDNMELFGSAGLENLTDLERVQIIRHLLSELPPGHPLREGRKDSYFFVDHLKNLFKDMKTEHLSPDFIRQKADEYLAQAQSGELEEFVYKRKTKDFKAGDLKQSAIDKLQQQLEQLKAAADLYPLYQQKLAEAGRYDYDDMILWVLEAFEKHPDLLLRYQEQYHYFLVDEYQDTNGAQNEVLQQLINYWEVPNVFIVGDDDQSIFEFQGARLKNLTDFYERYRDHLKVVVLEENYRSSQIILDAAVDLVSRNQIRVTRKLSGMPLEKKLKASNEAVADAGVPPMVRRYENRLVEVTAIADELASLRKKGFPMEEVAVLYAEHRQVKTLQELLERRGIPFQTRVSANALHQPVVQNLLLILQYLLREYLKPLSGDPLLVKIMQMPYFGIRPLDLARISVFLNREGNKGRSWREFIAVPENLTRLELQQPEAILRLSGILEEIIGDFAGLSLPALVERVVNRSGILASLFTEGKQSVRNLTESGRQQLVALHAFSAFVKKEAARRPRYTLAGILDAIRDMETHKIPISIPQMPFEKNPGKVNLSTAHSAKGLEFDRVYMIDCVDAHWDAKTSNGRYRFSFPPNLELSGEEDSIEARRRLFYVSMTRARSYLQLSYSEENDEGKGLNPSSYLQELMSSGLAAEQEESPEPEAILQAMTDLQKEMHPALAQIDEDLVRQELRSFELSISALNTYLRCPLSFYYEHVLKVPVSESEAAAFGQAMHAALEWAFRKMRKSDDLEFPPTDAITRIFEEDMHRRRASFGKTSYEQLRSNGATWLRQFCDENRDKWPTGAEVETLVSNVEISGVPVKGYIDRIDPLTGNAVHLVDYKTGSVDASRIKAPSEKEALGGAYWRQLVFYKLLFDNWPLSKGRKAISGEIAYLVPKAGKMKTARMEFTPEAVEFVEKLVVETWDKIQQLEFSEGCGKDDCAWCSFLKNQQNVDSFSDLEAEMLDDRQ